MNFLPIFLNVKDQSCLVVGGGDIAARKVALLRRAGAQVTVVASTLCKTLSEQSEKGRVHYQPKAFAPADVKNHTLIVGATNDPAVNEQVSIAARKQNIPVNIVDQPRLCTFIISLDSRPLSGIDSGVQRWRFSGAGPATAGAT